MSALSHTRIFSMLLTAMLLFASSAGAQTLPKGVVQVTATEGITEYRLPNGLKVLLFPDASKPTALVNITYLVGSRHENYGETGMAHLLEHMLFKGTPKHKNLPQEFSRRGMQVNGTTGVDRTNYYEVFEASDDNLQWAIGMEADRMVNAYIARKDLDSEMTVVRNEFESGENSPFEVMDKRMRSVMYDWHNYGNSPIGNRSDIENVRIDNLQAFYRTYYQPDNAVLLVAGKFDADRTLQWIVNVFGPIAKPKRSLPKHWTVEPTQDGERSFVARRKGDLKLVEVAYHTPGALHPDHTAMSFAASILAHTPNGRLHHLLVDSGQAVNTYQSSLDGLEPGYYKFGAVVKQDLPEGPVREALIAALESFYKTPPTAQEMERVRRDFVNSVDQTMSSPERLGVVLSESIALGDWRRLFQLRDQVLQVTPEQVAAAAQRYMRRDNRTVGVFLPENAPQRADIPTAPGITQAMRGFQPRAAVAASEAFDPSQANIDARTQRSRVGGVDLALLPKKNRGETVSVALALHMGDEKSLFGKQTVSQLTSAMLVRGTTRYTRQQLTDEISRLNISGDLFNFTTTRQHLDDALRLMAHVLREPSFPEAEFVSLRASAITATEAARQEPQALASQAMAQHFNRYPKGDWRAPVTLEETIAELQATSLDAVRAFHREFYGASKAELSIVGDFDPVQARQIVTQTLGQWSSATPYKRVASQYFDVPPKRLTINTPDKENGTYLARLNLEMRDDDPDYAALLAGAYLFGGAGMDSRLLQRIRQKEGWSYGGGAGFDIGALDRAATFNITAIAAPQNLQGVEGAVVEELDRLRQQGFSAEEVAGAKSALLQTNLQRHAQDESLAQTLNDYSYLGRSFAWNKGIEDQIRALTPAQVNAAWRRAIDPARLTVVLAGDQSKFQSGKAP
jgi:zinc protease